MANKKKKILPTNRWMLQNGYQGLSLCMHKHPELFESFKQECLLKTTNEWVRIAEGLEKEHGELPHKYWLVKNEYVSLKSCMANHPESFAHIKQDNKTGKTIEEWVETAEKLEKKYGELPSDSWLRATKSDSLRVCMRKYPKFFTHIKQEKKNKTIEEWVEIAKKLEKKYGELPHNYWLEKNKYSTLLSCMYRHPEEFKGIKQEYGYGKTKKIRTL